MYNTNDNIQLWYIHYSILKQDTYLASQVSNIWSIYIVDRLYEKHGAEVCYQLMKIANEQLLTKFRTKK